jgi:membrane-bound ClpP family serine protease
VDEYQSISLLLLLLLLLLLPLPLLNIVYKLYLTETCSNILVIQRDAKIEAHTEHMFTRQLQQISDQEVQR